MTTWTRTRQYALLPLAFAVVSSSVLAWALKPEMSSFWIAHGTAMFLWLAIQSEKFPGNVLATPTGKYLSNILGGICVGMSMGIGLLFLTSDAGAYALGGALAMLTLVSGMVYFGKRQSPDWGAWLGIALILVPAILGGVVGGVGLRMTKEAMRLSKLNDPVLTAYFDPGTAPNDLYWPRQIMAWEHSLSVPGNGFSWKERKLAPDLGEDEDSQDKTLLSIGMKATPATKAKHEHPTPRRISKVDFNVHGMLILPEGVVGSTSQPEDRSLFPAIRASRGYAQSFIDFLDNGEYVSLDNLDDPEQRKLIYATYPEGSYPNSLDDIDGARRDIPRTVDLVEGWKRQGMGDDAIIARTLHHFSQNLLYNYDYQIEDPKKETVDHLLFEQRKGVCDQFAEAFVRMMRIAGIPARKVTGFRGGERDPTNSSITVKVRDAHAWAEVWRGDEMGWVRIDPTDVVPVEKGIPEVGGFSFSQMFAFDGEAGMTRQGTVASNDRGPLLNWINNYAYWILAGAVVLISLLLLGGRQRSQQSIREPREDLAWRKLVAKLGKKGHCVSLAEGPRTLAMRAQDAFDVQTRARWHDVALRFEQWKYANQVDPSLARDILHLARRIRKKPKTPSPSGNNPTNLA